MTDTNTLAPADAEILDAAEDFRSQYTHGGTTFDEFDEMGFARAVLAKWGQPAQAASSAVLKAIREANMQLVRTGDDAFMLVPYKAAKAQAEEPVAWLRNTTDQIADYVADNWPMRKYDLPEIEQRLRMLAAAPSGPAR